MQEYIAVQPRDCHKSLEQNALIRSARACDEHRYELLAAVDYEKENFFFDHDIPHIPGMLISCMLRQGVVVIAHLFYDLPYTHRFILDEIHMHFSKLVLRDATVVMECSCSDIKQRRNVLRGITCAVDFKHNDEVIASGSISVRMMSEQINKRMASFKTGSRGG